MAAKKAAGTAAAPRLAKLSPPRLSQVVERDRLYAALDAGLARPVAWVCGPPGAGKTTLVAGYLASRRRRVLWYQVDRGDEDLASFFRHFEQAVGALSRRKGKPLPQFGPEFVTDIEGFTQACAREALARVPEGAVVVLDNVHDARSPLFPRMLHALFREVPGHVRIMAVSREVPPTELSRLVLNRLLSVIGADDLRFDADEAAELLASHEFDAAEVKRLQRETQGWAAGLILMSEGGPRAEGRKPPRRTRESLFAYFAKQVVEGLPASWQRFLLLTSVLPKVTAEAGNSLAGTRDGARILGSLHRQHLFVDRREERGDVFQYHALFRDFLAERAHATLPAAELEAARAAGARLAESEAWTEDAIALYLDGGAWDEAARIIGAVAQPLLSRGLAQTVEGWIDRFPAEALDRHPALSYYLGHSLIQRDDLAARAAYERAYAGFVRERDEGRALLAACAALETVFTSYRDWTGADRWIATVRKHRESAQVAERGIDALRARSGLLLALLLSADRGDDEVRRTTRELLGLLADDDIDVNERLRVASLMVDTASRAPDRESNLRRVEALVAPLLAHPVASPLLAARYLLFLSDEISSVAAGEEARRAWERARAVCERHGWAHMRFELAFRAVGIAFHSGDAEACAAGLEAVDRHARAGVLPQETIRAFSHYQVATITGDKDGAIRWAREFVDCARRANLPASDFCHALAVLGFACIAGGRYAEAAEIFDEAAGRIVGFERNQIEVWRDLSHAASLPAGAPNEPLGKALARARAIGMRSILNHVPDLARRLMAQAWRQGIEHDYVAEEIARRGFPADDPAEADWPWPLKVLALGEFSATAGGKALGTGGKAAKRPLDLLKFIVASGRRDVAAAQAVATLWPDLEGDQAKSAFNVALHRLRRLLGRDEAVTLDSGRLGLPENLVWVDVFAFESDAAAVDAHFARGEFAEGERRAERALDLYRGAFLGDTEEGGWQIVARTRLASRFNRLVVAAGQRWAMAGQPDRARRAYERALELDPVAEEIYRSLMLLLIGLGQQAEALRVYRRCRDMLSLVLGVKPSAQTQRVHEALRGE